jgi:hypothetical protein
MSIAPAVTKRALLADDYDDDGRLTPRDRIGSPVKPKTKGDVKSHILFLILLDTRKIGQKLRNIRESSLNLPICAPAVLCYQTLFLLTKGILNFEIDSTTKVRLFHLAFET